MSGGNNGGYVPSPKIIFDCETGTIITNVSSVDLIVLSNHSVGEILDVVLQNNAVVLENGNGETLGSILHANVIDLIECMKKNNAYEAEIISISGSQCRVKISKV